MQSYGNEQIKEQHVKSEIDNMAQSEADTSYYSRIPFKSKLGRQHEITKEAHNISDSIRWIYGDYPIQEIVYPIMDPGS